MTHLNPYLNFDGQTREAMEFYNDCLDGTLTMQTFGEAKASQEEGTKDRIIHAHLESDGIILMASDTMPGMPFTMGTNVSLSLVGTNAEQLTAAFASLSEGGKVTMPLEKQFWGDIFGMLTDKFGVHWMVNIETMK